MAAMIRVGAVGPGWWTETMYVPAVAAHPDAELVAICGRDHGRTSRFASEHGIEHVFTDPDEMYRSGLIDAVIISTVNKTHHPLTMAALDAGLHVLCEKPLAMDADEASEMADRARGADRCCLVPFTYRFMPIFQYVKRLLDDGFVGEPHLLNLRYFTGFARDGEYAWRFDLDEAGSGVLGDLGSHWIDMARWLLGEVTAVTCVLSHHVDRDPHPEGRDYAVGDDGANIILEFASGAQAVVVVSAVCYEDGPFGQSHHLDLHGSAGTLHALNDWNDRQEVRGAAVGDVIAPMPIPDDIWDGARRDTVHNTYRDVFRGQDVLTRGWLSAIRDGASVEPDFDDGAAVQRVIDACIVSAADGRRVPLD
jgi:predicted dehydrogenase